MGGYLEIYKLNPLKIKENLYPKLINTELNAVYIPETGSWIGHFKKFPEINKKNYRNTSPETIIRKLESPEPLIFDYDEFSLIIDWLTWYYRNEIDTDDLFLDENGLISIGSLNSKFEMTALFGLGCEGIEKYFFPLIPPGFTWNSGSFPLSQRELVLMTEYMLVFCIAIAGFLEDLSAVEMIEDIQPNAFADIKALKKSTEKHLQQYLSGNENLSYRQELNLLVDEKYYEHYSFILLDLKKNLTGYTGFIYTDECF
ncbi:hypothetical protein [uncultured Chryseobacterium sp.]|uniref:hypothetical protein n=1 Tax=uncultured Chryseobacterium sp. TaxID=259322 RepID=UPI0025F0354C|nr:hypothetical protein [uncultured Chryseobacterium sp.]